jgi:broad specificity phosphatase PhoE
VLEIVFETHALSVDNERGVATGWLPGQLSEYGKRQAKELGERRRDDGITAVYTSDLARAVETAEIAFGGTEMPVYRDARLRECNYGDLNGAPVTQLDAERARHIDEPFPNGESYRQAIDRVRAFVEELARTRDGKRVLVIGHGATRLALDHLANGVPLEDLVAAQFDWKEGWEYRFWRGRAGGAMLPR